MQRLPNQTGRARSFIDLPNWGLCLIACLSLNAPAVQAGTAALTRYPEEVAVPENAKFGDLKLEPCRFKLKADARDYAADCGTLIVPENRKRESGRLIALPLIRIHATGKNPAEPIFWFKGGPGASNVFRSSSTGLLERHDLVMVGYRGIDSSVKLECPELSEHMARAEGPMLGERAMASYAAGARECSARLEREGVDLAGYSMTETIDDQELARQALGYNKVDLLGQSYGTRLEMIYMWRYPQSLHRVVMIGINPPGGFVWDPAATDRKLFQYGALCAKDAYCSSRTDNLVATMQRVSDHMPQSWMGIPIEADRVRDLSFFMLHESVDAGDLPMPWSGPSAIDMWLDAAEGDASGMALTSLLSRLLMPKFMHWGHTLAMGSSTMDYVDPRRDYDRELALDHPIIGAPMSQIYRSVSWGWPANPDRVEYNEPQPSDIETLLINGTLDFTTPFEQPTRDKLLSQLSHGRFVQLRDLGHTATFWHSQDQARARLLNTFLDEGRVDDSLYVYQAPVFKVRGLDGFFDRLLLILAAACIAVTGLLWLVIRAVRRRWRARRLQPVV